MPQMKVETCFPPEARKYDAPRPSFTTFEIRNESSPENSPPFKDFFTGGHFVTSDVSQSACDKNDNLSLLSINSHQYGTTTSDLELHLPRQLNGHCSNGEESTNEEDGLFSDALLSSLTSKFNEKKDMKILNGYSTQKDGDLSDLLSSFSVPPTHKSEPICYAAEKERSDFSFFSVSPDNVFSTILSNLPSASTPPNNSDENSDSMSMLDLLKSVNSESSNSLTEYLNASDGNNKSSIKPDVSKDLNEILNIDLSACIKTSEISLNTISHNKPFENIFNNEENPTEIQLEMFMKPVFVENESIQNQPRINRSQGLFAKSLSCKPRKNHPALRKVSNIKIELYKHYFNTELPNVTEHNLKMKKDIYTNNNNVICKTNNCMVNFKGRRFCPKEVI